MTTNTNDEIEIDMGGDDGGVFRKGSTLYYQHESGRLFSCDETDIGDPDETHEVNSGLPHGVTVDDSDPQSQEGKAIDRWTEGIDEVVREGLAPAKASGGVPTMSATLRATSEAIAAGGL